MRHNRLCCHSRDLHSLLTCCYVALQPHCVPDQLRQLLIDHGFLLLEGLPRSYRPSSKTPVSRSAGLELQICDLSTLAVSLACCEMLLSSSCGHPASPWLTTAHSIQPVQPTCQLVLLVLHLLDGLLHLKLPFVASLRQPCTLLVDALPQVSHCAPAAAQRDLSRLAQAGACSNGTVLVARRLTSSSLAVLWVMLKLLACPQCQAVQHVTSSRKSSAILSGEACPLHRNTSDKPDPRQAQSQLAALLSKPGILQPAACEGTCPPDLKPYLRESTSSRSPSSFVMRVWTVL